MRRYIAFVPQDETYLPSPYLTVTDYLMFSAMVRFERGVSKEDRQFAVNRMLEMLNLRAAKDTPVIKCSGGERKRCSIGIELLIQNPSLLLIDEGTSGLDSAAALQLVRNVRKIATTSNLPVLMSLHQPATQIFMMFDRVVFLSAGEIVYSGFPHQLMHNLNRLGFSSIDENMAPSDLLISLLSFDNKSTEVDFLYHNISEDDYDTRSDISDDIESKGEGPLSKEAKFNETKETWRPFPAEAFPQGQFCLPRDVLIASFDKRTYQLDIDEAIEIATTAPAIEGKKEFSYDKYESSWNMHFYACLLRAMKANTSGRFTWLNLAQTIVVALLVGLAWYQTPNTENRVLDLSGYLFFTVTYFLFSGVFSGMIEFLPERPMLKRDRESGAYHLTAYYIAKQVSTAPVRIIIPLLFVGIALPMAAQNCTPEIWFGQAAVLVLASLTGESIGLFIGTLTLDFDRAVAMAILASLGILLLGGFYVKNLPFWIEWLKYTSPLKYAYSALSIIQFEWQKFTCDQAGGIIPECAGKNEVLDGALAVDFLRIGEQSLGLNFVCILLFLFGFRILAYITLRYLKLNTGGRT